MKFRHEILNEDLYFIDAHHSRDVLSKFKYQLYKF